MRTTNQKTKLSKLELLVQEVSIKSILEISHTNQIVLVFIYPDAATDESDSGLNISRFKIAPKRDKHVMKIFIVVPNLHVVQ